MVTLPGIVSRMDVSGFRKFLLSHGASMLHSTNEWEVLRYRARGQKKGVSIIYRDKRDRVNYAGNERHYRAFVEQRDPFAEIVHKPKISAADEIEQTHEDPAFDCDLWTDAGHIIQTKTGAWGAVLRVNGESFEAAGALKGEIRSSTSSEARGVANALHRFIVDGRIPRRARVRIVCDNRTVVSYINNGRRSKRADIDIAIRAIRELAFKRDLILRAEWVKGHQRKGQRSFDGDMNDRCDKLATAFCRQQHRERRANGQAV